MHRPRPEGAPHVSQIAPPDTAHPSRGRAIGQLARTVARLTRSGQTALDAELLQALVDLGDEARAIAGLAAQHGALLGILQELHGYGHFEPTGTECDDAYRAAKLRACRAASGAPDALWDPQAERELLETFLAASGEQALDRMVRDLADASGYLALIDVSWQYWHVGRHAEQAASLGMDGSLQRLLSAAWQIQQHVMGATDPAQALREQERIRAAHRAARERAMS